MQMNESIGAGQTLPYTEVGDFLRVLAAGGNLRIIYYRQGAEIARAENVGAGYAERFGMPFDKVVIQSDISQAFSIVTRLGNQVTYDQPPNGAVNGAFGQKAVTVTNASTQLLAANTSRRYLLIQNNDAAGTLYIGIDGTPAAINDGIKLDPGESLEFQGYVPTSLIAAIGSTASNPNVVVVEG
jgi:hypothetical protein